MGLVAEGDLVVAALPQASGTPKLRPALLLRRMPGFGDYLACGISSQIHQAIPDFDLVLRKDHPDFAASGLFTPSVVRLGFLGILGPAQMKRKLGRLSPGTMKAVRQKLAEFLTTNS